MIECYEAHFEVPNGIVVQLALEFILVVRSPSLSCMQVVVANSRDG
jgi:hypothetical protein